MTIHTPLMSGEIVHGTVLAAWLVESDNGSEAVMIMSPDQPTSVSPSHYGDLVAQVPRLLANSNTELADMSPFMIIGTALINLSGSNGTQLINATSARARSMRTAGATTPSAPSLTKIPSKRPSG
jgi:hypothetical protein